MQYDRDSLQVYTNSCFLNTVSQTLENAQGQLHYILKKAKELQHLNQLLQRWCYQKKWPVCHVMNVREQELIIEVPHTVATYILSSQQEILNFFHEEYSKDLLKIRVKVQSVTSTALPKIFKDKRILSKKAKMLLKNTANHLNPKLISLKHALERIAAHADFSS